MTRPVLLAVDGNSMLHRAYHAGADAPQRTRDGRPSWAVNGLISALLASVSRVGPQAIVVGFDDHGASVRKNDHPHYKAGRPEKPAELIEQIASAITTLRAAGIHVVVPAGLEADDVIASAARTAAQADWDCVIVTSDRDSFALINEHTCVLRVLNGGIAGSPMLSPSRLMMMYGVNPAQYRDYAAMRGDTSDNLLGIRGIGQKTAARILQAYGSTAAAFAAVDTDLDGVCENLGRSAAVKLADQDRRAAFAVTSEIMTMRADLDLGLELEVDNGRGRLPVPTEPLKAVLTEWGFHTVLAQARRLFCDEPIQQTRVQIDPNEGLDLPFGEPPDLEYDDIDPYIAAAGVPGQLETVTPHERFGAGRSKSAAAAPVQLELTLF